MDIFEIVTSRANGLGEKVFSAPNIPKDKLQGALEGITDSRAKAEDVISVLDITLFGACDNGVVFTNRAMYFCPLMGVSQEVVYEDMDSVIVKGTLLKELVVRTIHGSVIKIEATDFNAKTAATILNAIISAKNEEKRRAERTDQRFENDLKSKKGKRDFEKARYSIKLNAILLIACGLILSCCAIIWWGAAAIIIGIELLYIYTKDDGLYELDMPVSVYEKDVKDLILQAWLGASILIGVLGVPVLGKKTRKRIDAINKALIGIKVCKEEKILTTYLRYLDEKEDPLAWQFIGEFLDKKEERCEFIRLPLGEITMIFKPHFLEKTLEELDTKVRSEMRIDRQLLIDFVKNKIDTEDLPAENFINLPDNGIEAYSFSDGTYYVHGINNDKVRVCTSCGIASFVNDDINLDESTGDEFYCSDFCRETEEICKKRIADLRSQKLQKEGLDNASYGGALPAIIDSIRDNRRGAGKRERISSDNTLVQTGHGVAAEKANTRLDRLLGKSAKTLGDDNSANGPDRIVDGKLIQTKYCSSASKSVAAGFGNDGNYKYVDNNGNPMQLEVPRDQYEKALELMREKIKAGKVPGVSDPAEAEKLVRKGHLSYKQAQNICKFGTIESLTYDAYTGVIVGTTAGGISFVLTTAIAYYKTRDIKTSLRLALGSSIETGGKAFTVYVLSAQVQRTAFVKAFLHKSAMDINWGGHGKFVERIGRGLDKLSGAKSGTFSKNANVAVKGAAITAAATFAVTSAWEVGKLCCGKMSGMQCIKNISVSGGGIAAGSTGALVLGALMSPIPGGAFIGGLIGGAIGGMLGSGLTKVGMDKLIQDDIVMIMALVSDEFKILAASFCLNDDEIQEATVKLDKIISSNKNFIEDVFSKREFRRHYLARIIKPIFISICMQRPLLFNNDMSETSIEDSLASA